MTAATYTTSLTNVIVDAQTNSTTGWTALGGGASGLNAAETDYFIQNAQCLTKNAFASATKGMIYDTGADQGGSGTDGAYSVWTTHLTPNSLDTRANGGLQFLIGSGSGDFRQYYIGGKDTIEFGGWVFGAVKEQNSNWDATTGTPSATVEQFFGVQFKLVGGPTKGAPNAIDTVRVGRHDIKIEHGTAPDAAADLPGVITNLETVANRYGLLAQRTPGGSFENSGLVQFGTATNAVRFTDSDRVVFLRDHPHVTANFHTWEANNASSVVTLTNYTVKALGTTSRGRWITNNNATLAWTTCNFIDMGTFSFGTNSTINGCTFLRCNQVTHGGGTLNNSSVLSSNVAANAGAMFYDQAADPDGEMDGMTFSKGTNAHHAIEFGTSSPTTLTLRDCDFSGFSSSADNDGSVFRFNRTSGNVTLNLVGCTHDGSGFTVDDRAGCTVTVVIDPVTTLVHVNDDTGANLSGARVLLEAKDGTGDFPFEESVTIARTASTATVSHTAHGLSNNDWVVIRGANQPEYNGPHQISNVSENAYDYTVSGSPQTPATGTIISSGAILSGTTDASGDISASRTFSANTPVKGVVRKSTSSPRFKSFPLDGTINNTTGLTINVKMVKDE